MTNNQLKNLCRIIYGCTMVIVCAILRDSNREALSVKLAASIERLAED